MSKNPYVLWTSPSGHERIYVGAAAWIEAAPDGGIVLAGPGAARVGLRNVHAAAGVREGVTYARLRRGLRDNRLIPAPVVADINEDGPKTGTYAAYKVSRETAAHILCWARAQGLTHIMRPSHMHTTTVYSREPIDYRPSNKPIGARFEKFHLFPADSGESTLVAVVHSPALVDRWATALQAGATYDFPEYIPHVSLGRVPSDFDLKTLDPFPFPIQYAYEFAQMTRPAAPEGAPKGYSIGHELMLLAGADHLWTRAADAAFRRAGVPGTWETAAGPAVFGARDFIVRAHGSISVLSEAEGNTRWNRDLYYVQPNGTWKKGGDGRSKGRTRAELPKHATIADADDAEPRPVTCRLITEDDCRRIVADTQADFAKSVGAQVVHEAPASFVHITPTEAQQASIVARGFDLKYFGDTGRRLQTPDITRFDPAGVYATDGEDERPPSYSPWVTFTLKRPVTVLSSRTYLFQDLARVTGKTGHELTAHLRSLGFQVVRSVREYVILDPSIITITGQRGAPVQSGPPADQWTQEITLRVRAHENVNAIESLLRRIEDETKGGSGTSITVETGGGRAEFYMDGDGGDIIEVVSVTRLNGGAA